MKYEYFRTITFAFLLAFLMSACGITRKHSSFDKIVYRINGSMIEDISGNPLYHINGFNLEDSSGSIAYRMNGYDLEDTSGKTVYRIKNNFIEDASGKVIYKIEGRNISIY